MVNDPSLLSKVPPIVANKVNDLYGALRRAGWKGY